MKTIEPIDEIQFLRKTSKRLQAVFLTKLEDILFDDPKYDIVRKAYLDSMNDYTRLLVKRLVGEVEDLVK